MSLGTDSPPAPGAGGPAPVPQERSLVHLVAFNALLLVGGRIVVAASGVVGVAIATRYLGRDGFGQLTVALGFVSIFQAVTDVGLWTIVAREIGRRPEREREILDNGFAIGLCVSVAAAAVAAATMLLVYGSADRELVREGILIIGAQLLLAAPAGSAAAYMTAHQRAMPAAVGAVLGSALFIAGVIGTLALDLGFVAMAAAYAVTGGVAALVPAIPMLRETGGLRFRLDPQLSRMLIRWALPQGGVLILSILYFRIDTVLLSLLSTNAEVALYGVAFRVLEVLVLVPGYVMITLFPELARERAGSERLAALGQGTFSTLAVAALAVAVLFAAFAPDVVAIVGGSGFAGAAPVLRLLAVAVALVFTNVFFFQALVALNRQRDLLVLMGVLLAGNVVLNVVLIPVAGAQGAALALALSELIAAACAARLYRRVSVVPRLRRPLRLLVAVTATGLVALGLRELPPLDAAGPVVRLLVAGPIALGTYAGVLAALRALPPELEPLLAPWRSRLWGRR